MANHLIINARRQLSWNRRLFSDASTLALWSMWLWLCRSALLRLAGIVGVAIGMRHTAAHAQSPDDMVSFEDAAAALFGTCSLLMLWNRLASQPAPTPRVQFSPDYAGYFRIDPRELASARASRICVVHHDESGRILRIDPVRDGDPSPDGELSPGSGFPEDSELPVAA
ncbi:MAG TPA: poly-beta-1,6-N-acetyl-D-glucosamine biosynthesis protein PgaD [Steroidobacteraceae bacterium]|nr:poly-beta-1,6-N-acetyl-D-glucosamine biosynthesis protein PgaD [Steroidobacteraceae bacterium]